MAHLVPRVNGQERDLRIYDTPTAGQCEEASPSLENSSVTAVSPLSLYAAAMAAIYTQHNITKPRPGTFHHTAEWLKKTLT